MKRGKAEVIYIEAPRKKCKVILNKPSIDDGGYICDSLEFDDFKDYIIGEHFVIFKKNDGTERIISIDLIKEIYITREED